MKGLWRTYVLSNVHISLCAVVFCWAGYELLEIAINPCVLVFLFAGSLCTYTVHRIISGGQVSGALIGHERFSFVRKIGKWKIAYLSIIIFVSLFSFSMLSQQLRLYLAVLSALCIGYIIPILGSKKRLRDINMLKIFLVALVWAGIFMIPLSEMKESSWSSSFLFLFIEKFIFIFALTLPFDLRDRKLDQASQLNTFASSLSTKKVKIIISILLIACLSLSFLLYFSETYSFYVMLSLCGFYTIQAFLSLRITSKTTEIYYLGLLDGLIMLQAILIIFA
jgi:4-hydroxybenzoate polyprenyltransferase